MKKNIVIVILSVVILFLLLFLLGDRRLVIETGDAPPASTVRSELEGQGSDRAAMTGEPDDGQAGEQEKPDRENAGEEASLEQGRTEAPETAGAAASSEPGVSRSGNQPNASGKIVVLDAGHQKKGNSEQEPIAPGAGQTKPKVASGTQGVVSKVPEYVVTLQVAQKLKEELSRRGYQVIMVREVNEVNISNSERAQIANNAGADAFVRLHCNGIDNASTHGALTMCQTASNPYCGEWYAPSRRLSECVLAGLCQATGAKNQGVSETDTMSGINWCTVPVTIVEMGFMTNPEEDRLLTDDGYQNKLAHGIANGLDEYFRQ